MESAVSYLSELLTTTGTRVFFAALALIIGFILVKYLTKRLVKMKFFQKIDSSLASFLKSFVTILLYALVCLEAASILGISMTSLLTVFASAGVAIGLAMQGALSNFAGGLMLLLFKPFKVGDYIETEDYDGTVEAVTVFYTILQTPDNKRITLPNGTLTNAAIVNYSSNETRRVDLEFSAGYASDIKRVKELMLSAASAHESVLREPAPEAHLLRHGDNALEFVMRVWCKTDAYWTVKFDLLENIKELFDENGIEIPYPQMDIHLCSNGNEAGK